MVKRAFGWALVFAAIAACTSEIVTWEEPPEGDIPSRPDDEGGDERRQPDDADDRDDEDRGAPDDAEDDDGDDAPDGDDEGDDSGPDDLGNEVTGIPAGQMPPPGSCRVWHPDRPPGQQPPPGDCATLSGDVPAGAWLLYRPTDEARVYRIA